MVKKQQLEVFFYSFNLLTLYKLTYYTPKLRADLYSLPLYMYLPSITLPHPRYCGYIIDSGEKGGEKRFQFHGFKMEPNTDQLCLCLHSACQARYQRVMDANPEAVKKREEESKEKEVGSRLVYNAVISLRPLATNF